MTLTRNDVVERFQLSLMLTVIAIRNMIEMAGSDLAFLPKSFIKGKNLFDSIASVGHLRTLFKSWFDGHCWADS